jgi:hypothetical protein
LKNSEGAVEVVEAAGAAEAVLIGEDHQYIESLYPNGHGNIIGLQ